MYKMLIVEDERWEREGLIDFLDWKSLGIEVAGTAFDGIDGIEKAKNFKPDIIITDIKMPGIDGIEMSKRIKVFLPEVKIILLTGYDDFKFAKEAISFNASGYVLKPVEETELLEVVTKIVEEFTRERKWFINEFEKIKKNIRCTGIDVEIHCYRGIAVKFDAVSEETDKLFEKLQLVYKPDNEIDRLIYVYLPVVNEDINATHAIWELEKEIKIIHVSNSYIGVGDTVGDISNINHSFSQARHALEYAEFWNRHDISFYREVEEKSKEFEAAASDFLLKGNYFSKQILHGVRSQDKTRVMELLKELFDYIYSNKGMAPDFIRNYLYSLLNETTLLLYNINENISDMGCKESESVNQLLSLTGIGHIRTFITNYFEMILDYINDKRNNKDDYIIKKVIQIIEQKYMEDISLKSIAGEVYLSTNYLGTMFKKQTGSSFNDFLNNCRMEKARELLQSPKNKVTKVSQDVGIANTSYFCVLFKNKYGIAPGEYQESVIRG